MKPDTRRPNPVFADLDAAGLNLQAVFDVARLPADLQRRLFAGAHGGYRQLLLIGHLGPTFWQQATAAGMEGEHPLDAFTGTRVAAWLSRHFRECVMPCSTPATSQSASSGRPSPAARPEFPACP